jgi:hypothetical protein
MLPIVGVFLFVLKNKIAKVMQVITWKKEWGLFMWGLRDRRTTAIEKVSQTSDFLCPEHQAKILLMEQMV